MALSAHLFLVNKTTVRQTPQHAPFRSMLLFGKSNADTTEDDMCIKTEGNAYSDVFINLLTEYYLYL